jgi:hypothetical protein
MPVGPFSRYANLPILELLHATRGTTRSLPIRRPPVSPPPPGSLQHRYAGFETADLLALKYLGREELYWHLLDANGGRLPVAYEPGETLVIPALETATRVVRPGR